MIIQFNISFPAPGQLNEEFDFHHCRPFKDDNRNALFAHLCAKAISDVSTLVNELPKEEVQLKLDAQLADYEQHLKENAEQLKQTEPHDSH